MRQARIDAYRELDGDAQVFLGVQLWQDCRAKAVPYLRWNGSPEPQCRLLACRNGKRDLGFAGTRHRNGIEISARACLVFRLHRLRAVGCIAESLRLGLGQQIDPGFEGHFVLTHWLSEPHAFVLTVALLSRCQSEVSGGYEFDDFPLEDRIRVDEPGQCAVQEALTQTT